MRVCDREHEDLSCKSPSRPKRAQAEVLALLFRDGPAWREGQKRKSAILVQGGMTILGDKITVISCAALDNWQDRGRTPRSCRTTASTSHLGHHTPRTTELDTSPPEHLHFSPPHKSTQRAERDLLDWDL
ncbi:UNVERIFIED_CONTAM: hypothetical protein FKN15_036062 [Acipenser sinensis]